MNLEKIGSNSRQEETLRNAIIEGNYESVNAIIKETNRVSDFLRPLANVHPFDLAIHEGQFKILRALIDHTIRETGVEIFVDILRTTNVQKLDIVFLDLIERYPVAAHSLMDSYVSYSKLNGHPVFKEALQLSTALFCNPKVVKRMAKLNRNELLRHPLVEIYLETKWNQFHSMFYFGFIFEIILAVNVTTCVIIWRNIYNPMTSETLIAFRILGLILISIHLLYQFLNAIRSIMTHKRIIFKPFLLLKEGLFIGFVFAAFIAGDHPFEFLRGRATIISWARLFMSISCIPDRRCLYAHAFRCVLLEAFFKAGIGSGIFFPLIGLILGSYAMSPKGMPKLNEPLESKVVFVAFIIFGIIVITYLVGLSVSKVRDEVLSQRGEDYILRQKAIMVYKYERHATFWSKILACMKVKPLPSLFIIFPRQFERHGNFFKSLCARLKGQGGVLPLYCQINEEGSDSLDYTHIVETDHVIPSSIIDSIPHPTAPNDSGYTNLYWNNEYESYYQVNTGPSVFTGKKRESEDDYEIVEPKAKSKYQLMKEAIMSEIKRDYGLTTRKEEETSVNVRPGLALGLITLQAGQSRLKLNPNRNGID